MGPRFRFVQMADTQLGLTATVKAAQWLRCLISSLTCGLWKPPILRDLTAPGSTRASVARQEEDFMHRCVQCVNEMEPRPAFVCVCGDLVNAMPNRTPAEAALQEEQAARYKVIMSGIDPRIPLVCVCGNHDIGDRPDAASIQLYKARFGDDYFSFWVGGCKFLVINSQLYKDATLCAGLAAEQDAWLDEQLEAPDTRQAVHVVVLSHIPPYIYSGSEPSAYFNFTREVRQNLLSRMARGRVKLWLCGHFHANAGGVVSVPVEAEDGSTIDWQIEVVVTGAVGAMIERRDGATLPELVGLEGMEALKLDARSSGMRVLEVAKGSIRHSWHSIEELESTVVASNHVVEAEVVAQPLLEKH
eukprot:scaffold10_cov257-Pinguiococcus_pyrenoidosus.AAC.31